MNVNETVELDIISNGMNGEGVARHDGKVVFVPYTLAGEHVRAVVKQVKSRYAVCSVIKILSASPERVAPACPYYFRCGGCDTLHIAPDMRLEVLISELKSNLKKIAGLDVPNVQFVPTPDGEARRNKLSMPFAYKDGKVVLGLYRQNTHVVEPVECMYCGELSKKTAATVCAFANEKKLSIYDEKSGKGLLRHLVVREIEGRAAAVVVINGDNIAGERQLAGLMPSGVDLFVCPNKKRNNVIMGESVRLVAGDPALKVSVLGVEAELSPLSFFQVNDYIRDKLYADAIAELRSDTLVDLYSGIGITSNLAAAKGKRVIAVECVPQAVADADRTAAQNGNADKITNICGDVQDVIGEITANLHAFDVLIDPPRKGCGVAVAEAIAACAPEKLIYVSCNHATMCRDVRAFLNASKAEYAVTNCRMYDMFCGTHHTETLFVLSKKPTVISTDDFCFGYDLTTVR